MRVGGIHVLGLTALMFGILAASATEYYTTRYQSLPVQDWLESRPPLAEAPALPSATELAYGLLRVLPLMSMRDDARPLLPVFGPPAVVQRTMGGVRDAARFELGMPGGFGQGSQPINARLDIIVFNRSLRAAAWVELMHHELDQRDPHTGALQVRIEPVATGDGMWVVAPGAGGGIATVAGSRGPVGYELQIVCTRPGASSPADLLDLSARAEAIARTAAADWTAWLEGEVERAGA